MRIVWIVVGAVVGPLLGAIAGFGVALVAMSLGPPRTDGSYGMREVLICLPLGGLAGLVIGILLALRFGAP